MLKLKMVQIGVAFLGFVGLWVGGPGYASSQPAMAKTPPITFWVSGPQTMEAADQILAALSAGAASNPDIYLAHGLLGASQLPEKIAGSDVTGLRNAYTSLFYCMLFPLKELSNNVYLQIFPAGQALPQSQIYRRQYLLCQISQYLKTCSGPSNAANKKAAQQRLASLPAAHDLYLEFRSMGIVDATLGDAIGIAQAAHDKNLAGAGMYTDLPSSGEIYADVFAHTRAQSLKNHRPLVDNLYTCMLENKQQIRDCFAFPPSQTQQQALLSLVAADLQLANPALAAIR